MSQVRWLEAARWTARSCEELRALQPTKASGKYRIDPDGVLSGEEPIDVFCNMTTGATLVSHDAIDDEGEAGMKRGALYGHICCCINLMVCFITKPIVVPTGETSTTQCVEGTNCSLYVLCSPDANRVQWTTASVADASSATSPTECPCAS